MKKTYLTVTKRAANELTKKISSENNPKILGIKLSLQTKGCSGMAYDINFATEENVEDNNDIIEIDKLHIYISPSLSLYLFGTELDYIEQKTAEGLIIQSSFQFKNPNEAGRCGCGASFYVE